MYLVYLNFLFPFTFTMYLDSHCFIYVFMFDSLFYFVVDVLITIDIGL